MSAYEPFHNYVHVVFLPRFPPNCIASSVYEPEIGDMDECIVEGCEDSGNAKDELSCGLLSIAQY
jgi:hypothetical protein